MGGYHRRPCGKGEVFGISASHGTHHTLPHHEEEICLIPTTNHAWQGEERSFPVSGYQFNPASVTVEGQGPVDEEVPHNDFPGVDTQEQTHDHKQK